MCCHLPVRRSGTQWKCKGAADTALPFKCSMGTVSLAAAGEDADVLMGLLLEEWCTVLKTTV